jgi:hypothetical protein
VTQATDEVVLLEGPLATPVTITGSGSPVLYLRAEEAWAEHDPLAAPLAERFRVISPAIALSEANLTALDTIHDLLIYVNDPLARGTLTDRNRGRGALYGKRVIGTRNKAFWTSY